MTNNEALEILQACGVELGEDFHALPSENVLHLLDAAVKRRYRKPNKANGSKARYFHAMLQRKAENANRED